MKNKGGKDNIGLVKIHSEQITQVSEGQFELYKKVISKADSQGLFLKPLVII